MFMSKDVSTAWNSLIYQQTKLTPTSVYQDESFSDDSDDYYLTLEFDEWVDADISSLTRKLNEISIKIKNLLYKFYVDENGKIKIFRTDRSVSVSGPMVGSMQYSMETESLILSIQFYVHRSS